MTAVAFLVAAALGALVRYLAGRGAVALGRPSGQATLLVNALGSFALGAIAGIGQPWALILGTGLLGAFTTFSGFVAELDVDRRAGRPMRAVLHLVVGLISALGGAWLGLALSR